MASWPDDFRKVNSRVPGTRTHVEDALADCDPGSLPAIQNYRAPHTVLQSESRRLIIVRTQNVIAIHAEKLSAQAHGCIDEFQARNPRPSGIKN